MYVQLIFQIGADTYEMMLTRKGAYAEYIVVPEGMVLAKPKELSWVEAAALPENWMTGVSGPS